MNGKTATLFELRFQTEGTTGTGPAMARVRNRKLASEQWDTDEGREDRSPSRGSDRIQPISRLRFH